MAITLKLADFCANLTAGNIDAKVARRSRMLLLDLLGNILRARGEASLGPSLLAALKAMGLGPIGAWDAAEGCSVIGDDRSWTPAAAALLNGAYAHALDFDDTHAAGSLHPGAPVIAAALAAAEMQRAGAGDLLAGIVAGYEVTCRLALALPAGAHYDRGFHPSATCGAFGAAAAAGRIFGLDGERIASAFGIALSQASGSLQFQANGAWTKPFQVGWAAQCGLFAATLAREGFRGAADALDGRHGFLAGYAPAPRPERLTESLGQAYELMATGVKPYPSCRYGHAGIDAVLALRSRHRLSPDQIDRIIYGISRAGLLLVGEPLADKQRPVNVVDAQFSAPFVLSVALAKGEMTWESYELLGDPAIRDLLARVECVHDPEIEREFPANMSGRITITTRTGSSFTQKVIVPVGEPQNFLTEQALRNKFMSLAGTTLSAPAARALADAVLLADVFPDAATIGWLCRKELEAI
jgi:2-methylcitrate dehydratase PrpD